MQDSLNDIRLTPQMLAAFYGQSLVAPVDNTRVKTTPSPASAIRILGANKKEITILVNSPAHTFLPENEMTFLAKMLEACRMNIDDVAIVNMAANLDPIDRLYSQLQPSVILDFSRTGQDLPVFEPTTQNGVTTLLAPALSAFVSDQPSARQLKSKLWTALKQVFSI